MFEIIEHGDLLTMFPAAELLMNHADFPGQGLLIHTPASPCLQHEISSIFFTSRIVTEERNDARPLRDDRLSFIALPAFVNLTQSAKLSRYILLTQIQY